MRINKLLATTNKNTERKQNGIAQIEDFKDRQIPR